MSARASKSRREKPVELPADVRLTHPDRVIYREQGITKRDLALYYARVAEWILPHVAERPLSLVRCPEGVDHECFYQKHPPQGLPDSVTRIEVEESSGPDTYLVVHDLAGLLALIQFGALELHVWGARADKIERSDRLVFDFDPDASVPWKQVIAAALEMRELLAQLELTSFVKTTGGKGLHIVVPIDRRHDWKTVKSFCRAVATTLTQLRPDRYIATASKAARRGKIFVDYLRNDRGATAVAPYSTRARQGAPISWPLSWRELEQLAGPATITVQNVSEFLAGRRDPWRELPQIEQRLSAKILKLLKAV
ncbi:MAG: non-homologous end-joining DNA ligase [Planctomycetaceae bacterium]|nr:non-homologous end-joining DNA ligase [Planctomycetaceae bacterium]